MSSFPRPAPLRLGVPLAATLVLAACGSLNDSVGGPASSPPPAGEVTQGGTLRLAVGSDAGCVDPQQVGSNDSIYSVRHLVDSLTDQDPETGEIVPWLAESWEVDDEARQYTFTLQEGVTFSDGSPLDAEAVAANLDAIVDLGGRAAQASGYLTGYTGTEIVDDLTLTVSFDQPNAQFLQATSTHFLGILSEESVAQSPDERCAGVIGSGPFELETYEPNASIVLTQRADYGWGSSLWDHEGAPYLDRVEVSVVPESGVRVGSLQSGQLDLIGNIAAQDETALQGSGAQLLARSNPGVPFGLSLNHDTALLSDPEVRKAISAAIDREEIVEAVFTSYAVPATSILASTTPLYSDQSALLRHDPEAAEQILQDAGYARGDDGVYARDGERAAFEILWFNNAATNAPTLELVQQQLRQVGIEVTLTEGQVAEWGSIIAEGNFEANWSNVTRADADILRTSFHSGLGNTYRLPPSDLDDVLEEQGGTPDPDRRAELVEQAQQRIVTDLLTIPVVELTTVLAAGEDVRGVRFDAGSRIQLFDAWIQQ